MPDSPDQEWRRLTAHYADMWDNEVLALAADYNDLIEMARQVLRDEMLKRKLGDPAAPPASNHIQVRAAVVSTPRKNFDMLTGPLPNSYLVPDEDPSWSEAEDGPAADSHDYTWKTRLCDCDEVLQAQQISAALGRAGIESWIESMAGYMIGVGGPRIFVPADQLEDARRILAQPIPQDILDESKVEVPEYVMPNCPRCGDAEPTLVAAEPSNQWLCECCGNEWIDPPLNRTTPDPQSRSGRHSAPLQVQKTERAARQQGSSSLRENSSNGGKAIRTFWLHSRFRLPGCQGLF